MSNLSANIVNGAACRFCERNFVDDTNKPYSHGHLTVCWECWPLLGWRDHLGYKRSLTKTSQEGDIWTLRKSEILREIQGELESDFKALDFEIKIKREERKEVFEDLILPKLKKWLDDDISWDVKKCCYTLRLMKDNQSVIMDFYPKGNKLLIRHENRWYQNGSKWLLKNVLPAEYASDEL